MAAWLQRTSQEPLCSPMLQKMSSSKWLQASALNSRLRMTQWYFPHSSLSLSSLSSLYLLHSHTFVLVRRNSTNVSRRIPLRGPFRAQLREHLWMVLWSVPLPQRYILQRHLSQAQTSSRPSYPSTPLRASLHHPPDLRCSFRCTLSGTYFFFSSSSFRQIVKKYCGTQSCVRSSLAYFIGSMFWTEKQAKHIEKKRKKKKASKNEEQNKEPN